MLGFAWTCASQRLEWPSWPEAKTSKHRSGSHVHAQSEQSQQDYLWHPVHPARSLLGSLKLVSAMTTSDERDVQPSKNSLCADAAGHERENDRSQWQHCSKCTFALLAIVMSDDAEL